MNKQRRIQIWVDADACPNVIKNVLFRAARRVGITTTFVANQVLNIPPSPFLKKLKVGAGFDVADNRIVEELHEGDLVITADIPLASEAIKKGAFALNPRGAYYTEENIRQRLTMRNFMEELRSGGVNTGGPPVFNQTDIQEFANQLDRFLTKHFPHKSD